MTEEDNSDIQSVIGLGVKLMNSGTVKDRDHVKRLYDKDLFKRLGKLLEDNVK